MKKKNLLAMKKLQATPKMLKDAEDNPIEEKKVRLPYGYTTVKTSRYGRYFRAVQQDGILKVSIFLQRELERGDRIPRYDVYCDKENEEYTTYEYGERKWRTAKIDNLDYPGINYLTEGLNWQQDKDRKLVNDYFETGQNKDIYEAVLSFQAGIKADRLRQKHRNELEEIDETMREVPDIPKNFKDWIAKNCFRETMFYEPDSMCHHRWPRMYCTHCRQWMDTQSYSNRPEHNKEGRCPNCGAPITYKSWNRQKYVEDETDVGLLQRLKDDSGWIIRTFICRIKRKHETGWQEYELSVFEDTRTRLDDSFNEREYFEYGEYKYTGVDRWCHECRRSQWGYYKQVGRVIMYTPNLKRELKREAFGRMDMKKIMRGGERERVRPVDILRKLRQRPYVEYLQKSGLTNLVDEIMGYREPATLFDNEKPRIHEVLKLDKQRFQRLQKLNGGCVALRLLQYEKEKSQKISDDTIRFLEKRCDNEDVRNLIGVIERTGMNAQRTVNYLRKQMEVTGQGYGEIFRHYEDYLDMAEVFGMDITDEIVCRQPKLMEYHDRYLARKNREKNKTRDKEVDLKYPGIRNNEAKNKERFKFKTEKYQIVVPHTASDITKEGRRQHHCVGASDAYIASMNNEKSFILFLRKNEDLKKPYYTLEVTWDGEIKQFYAAYDRQPDREEIVKVLSEFTKKVQEEKNNGTNQTISDIQPVQRGA